MFVFIEVVDSLSYALKTSYDLKIILQNCLIYCEASKIRQIHFAILSVSIILDLII